MSMIALQTDLIEAQPNATEESCWALVPVKDLDAGKQRLKPCLGDHCRGLSVAMLTDVLKALRDSERIERVIVVTADDAVAKLARELGATVEPEQSAAGLNAAVNLALDSAWELAGRRIIILPSDLPLATGSELDRLLDELDRRRRTAGRPVVGLCASRDGGGTNLLCLDSGAEFSPLYGPDSYRLHREGSRALGNTPHSLHSETLALDMDSEADLKRFIDFCRSRPIHQRSATWKFLQENGLLSLPTLAKDDSLNGLMAEAARLRDLGHGKLVTYSRKVFIPLTRLCRDVCHYCTFATMPKHLPSAYMSADDVVELARQGRNLGCKEALFTLGEKPELRHAAAREALEEMGFATTLEYVAHVAKRVMDETGLLPHINAGCMSPEEIALLKPVSASMGIMLESVSERLCEKGQVHYGSPDKNPAVRLQTIKDAGRARVPFTTGILIGIGETRQEILDSLLAIREIHDEFGHIQEVIIQNFVPKADTKMASVTPPGEEDLLWTIAMARLIFGPEMSIQAPPNLNPGRLQALVDAGINDWGGVSPLTPDHVNPESPWPHLDALANETAKAGKLLQQRLTVYPLFLQNDDCWLDRESHRHALRLADGQGLGREDSWITGHSTQVPDWAVFESSQAGTLPAATSAIRGLLDAAVEGSRDLSETEIVQLFSARGRDFDVVCAAADELRRQTCGDNVTYVVNRNINYTNICTYRCKFCAFAKGRKRTPASDAPYLKGPDEVARLAAEAWDRGATEVCLQGGIHPSFTGDTYLEILQAVHAAVPEIHIHAFSPLEVTHGAHSLGLPLTDFLSMLRQAGLKTLPGTAAEILSDDVREIICPDKLNSSAWLGVLEAAHGLGLATTATIMFGHVDRYRHWAIHLQRVLELQRKTAGITEFVPLPFVAEEAPIFRRGQARMGPTFRESVLMHAVSRLVLGRAIPNIQTSWVKMGIEGAKTCLRAGANDLGGTLMNESITRAAGAQHGQEMTPARLEQAIRETGRAAMERSTLYRTVAA